VGSPERGRVTVKVKPGSHRPGVWREQGAVVVAVRERAVDGAANAAVIAAIAAWLGVAPSRITIERGGSARTKRLGIENVAGPALTAALAALRSAERD